MSNQTPQQEQQQQKTFTCFDCKQQIKLRRKEDDSGWLRFNLDGVTEHDCQNKKKKQQQSTNANAPSNNNNPDPTEMRVIVELLQLVNKKLDALLANQGVKVPT